jgi:hypothetical protein
MTKEEKIAASWINSTSLSLSVLFPEAEKRLSFLFSQLPAALTSSINLSKFPEMTFLSSASGQLQSTKWVYECTFHVQSGDHFHHKTILCNIFTYQPTNTQPGQQLEQSPQEKRQLLILEIKLRGADSLGGAKLNVEMKIIFLNCSSSLGR